MLDYPRRHFAGQERPSQTVDAIEKEYQAVELRVGEVAGAMIAGHDA